MFDRRLPSDPAPAALVPEWQQRLIAYFYKAGSNAETIDENDHYKFCRRLVNLAFDGCPDPWVTAFYYHYGRHPAKLIPEWLWREEDASRLGPNLADMLKSDLFTASAEIPDYDPSVPFLLPPSQWRQMQLPLDPPDSRNRGGQSPLRRIVKRTPERSRETGRVWIYKEVLECGHRHVEFPDGDLRSKRRRCPQCRASAVPACAPALRTGS